MTEKGAPANINSRYLLYPFDARPDLSFLTDHEDLELAPFPHKVDPKASSSVLVPALLRSPVPLLERFTIFHDKVNAIIESERAVRALDAKIQKFSSLLLKNNEPQLQKELLERAKATKLVLSGQSDKLYPSDIYRMIAGLARAVIEDMVKEDILPTFTMISKVVYVYVNAGLTPEAVDLYKYYMSERFQLEPKSSIYQGFLRGCVAEKNLELAEKLFQERNELFMHKEGPNKNLVLMMIHLAARVDNLDKAIDYLNLCCDEYKYVPIPEQLHLLRLRCIQLERTDVWNAVVTKCRLLTRHSTVWDNPKPTLFGKRGAKSHMKNSGYNQSDVSSELPIVNPKRERKIDAKLKKLKADRQKFSPVLELSDKELLTVAELSRKRKLRNKGVVFRSDVLKRTLNK